MVNLKNKKITILGGKRSGMALARLIIRLGGIAKISEQASESSLPEDFRNWAIARNVALEFNGHTQAFIEESDLVVLSPGIRFNAPPVKWAHDRGIAVLGEIEFAAQFCNKPIIAVTGSNGKTTVVTLINKVLQKAGYKSCLCGNVGMPFSEFVLESNKKDFFVLEISSFQLESLLDLNSSFRGNHSNGVLHFQGFKPFIAVVLNFSQNHLDRHKDLEEYFQAKMRIFLNQTSEDFAVLNYQDERLKEYSSQLESKVIFFNSTQNQTAKEIKNPNHSVVIKVAKILGIEESVCQNVFTTFEGVEHRLEVVRSLDGVKYINDSKATTAESGRWALKSIDQPIVMICGGRDKNIDFTVLKDLVKSKVKRMLVIGEAKAKLSQAFEGVVPVEECNSLEDAVLRAKEIAHQGDCVVLTPMCASFDMFLDYEDRGRKFKDIVNKL